MRTTVSKSGKLSLSFASRRRSRLRNKGRGRADIVSSDSTESTAGTENVVRAQAEKRPGISESLKDFPLREKMVPSYSNKRDLKDIIKHRISYADVYNADSFIYLSIAQTLHVFEKNRRGIPAHWLEDTLPVIYEKTRVIREDGTSFITEMDKNFHQRSELYSQYLTWLRDEFIWIYNSSTGFDEDGERIDNDEFNERRNAAFAELSEIIPTLWT